METRLLCQVTRPLDAAVSVAIAGPGHNVLRALTVTTAPPIAEHARTAMKAIQTASRAAPSPTAMDVQQRFGETLLMAASAAAATAGPDRAAVPAA